MMTLEELLRKQVAVDPDTTFSPDFRVAVQEIYPDRGVRIIVHAHGYSSKTLDLVVLDNVCVTLEQGADIRKKGKK